MAPRRASATAARRTPAVAFTATPDCLTGSARRDTSVHAACDRRRLAIDFARCGACKSLVPSPLCPHVQGCGG